MTDRMTGKKGVQYLVVEEAGYIGESDVARFGTRWAAENWMNRTYSAKLIQVLHVDICMEEDGRRTYDPCGFGEKHNG